MPPESPKHTFHWKNQTSDLAKNASLLKSRTHTCTCIRTYDTNSGAQRSENTREICIIWLHFCIKALKTFRISYVFIFLIFLFHFNDRSTQSIYPASFEMFQQELNSHRVQRVTWSMSLIYLHLISSLENRAEAEIFLLHDNFSLF